MKDLATASLEFKVTQNAGSSGIVLPTTSVTIQDVASVSVKAGGAGAHRGAVNCLLSGVGGPTGYVQADAAAFKLQGTSEKVLVDGKPALLQGDHADVNVTLVHATASPIEASMRVEVDSAGQTKVRGI